MSATLQASQKQEEDTYRNYSGSKHQRRVEHFYATKYKNQTVQYNIDIRRRYIHEFNRAKMTTWDALLLLNTVVDESDPDVDVSQIHHALQTAEACRKAAPEDDWFHLLGLIHDLGKILSTPKFGNLEQWEVVGDIFPVGCEFDMKANVLSNLYDCSDKENSSYTSKFGIYQKKMNNDHKTDEDTSASPPGFDKVMMSFSHDEYFYQVLKNHPENKLPEEAMYCIRYHSFYPWHNKGGYMHLANEKDMKMLPFIKKFQQCDLYSKVDEENTDVAGLEKYYKELIEKYVPGVISW